MHKSKFKYGFALTELLVSITIMAVLSLLVVFAVAKKTQKQLMLPSGGRIVCFKDMNGTLHQIIEENDLNGAAKEPIRKTGITSCEFEIPANAVNVTVYVIGGGGGGASAPTDEELANSSIFAVQDVGPIYLDYDPDTSLTTYNNNIPATDAVLYVVGSYLCDLTINFPSISGSNAICRYGNVPLANFGIKSISKLSSKTGSKSIQKTALYNRSADFKEHFTESFLDNLLGNYDSSLFSRSLPLSFDRVVGVSRDYKEKGKLLPYSVSISDSYAYYKGGDPVSATSTFYNAIMSKRIFEAHLKKIGGNMTIHYGTSGANGDVLKCDTGKAYAGKKIVIESGKIGSGGLVGHPGGDTIFEDKWGGNCYLESLGGNAGIKTVTNYSFDKECKNYKLDSDYELKKSKAAEIIPDDPRAVSEYYNMDKDALKGIADITRSIIPNSVCITTADGETDISRFEDYQYKNDIALNYGGGGGGYSPCANFACVTSARVDYVKPDGSTEHKTFQYKGSEAIPPMTPEDYVFGQSTKGMGGAIIMKWRGK